jgi:molecular chaperone HtpG
MRLKESRFKAGMYLLETLTAGMYNEPLSIYREYVQNAVDSFDLVKQAKRPGPQLIKIELDPLEKFISIRDNAFGISSKSAEETLSRIGGSEKRKEKFRGFRGIGRLGGLAFCDKAVFKTKAVGEIVESVQEWDCKKLRGLLADAEQQEMSLRDLFDETTAFYQSNSQKVEGSYFEVKLMNVSSFRNQILDVRQIKKYLQTVAPLPFNPEEFEYAGEVSDYLSKKISNYVEMKIKLNGRQVFKPYKNWIKSTNKRTDPLIGIEFFDIITSEGRIASGWYGKRKNLIGAINRGEGISGIRVRDGNIMIGDEHILDNCFRETRFNSYVLGEVHIHSPKLVPNSRRDDFVDNQTKTEFYNMVDRDIGLPLSKEIRLRSRLKSQGQLGQDKQTGIVNPTLQVNKAEIGDAERKTLEKEFFVQPSPEMVLAEIFEKCGRYKKVKEIKEKYGY